MRQAFGRIVPGMSSIGLSAVRVLNGDFAAMLRTAGGFTTPWDDAPIMAMCAQGDLVPLRVDADHNRLARIRRMSLMKVTSRGYDVLYVGRRHLAELAGHVAIGTP